MTANIITDAGFLFCITGVSTVGSQAITRVFDQLQPRLQLTLYDCNSAYN